MAGSLLELPAKGSDSDDPPLKGGRTSGMLMERCAPAGYVAGGDCPSTSYAGPPPLPGEDLRLSEPDADAGGVARFEAVLRRVLPRVLIELVEVALTLTEH